MPTRKNTYEAKRTLPLTNREAEAVFDVTAMTLHLWKQGTPTKTKLPFTKARGKVRYPVRGLLEWAKRNEVPIAVHPDDLAQPAAAQVQASAKKPGPKPRASVSSLSAERPMAA